MGIIAVCGLLLVIGLAIGWRWSARAFQGPAPAADLSVAEVARRYIWYASIVLVSSLAAGLTVIGAGGRLAMRLLAVTSGDGAQGAITEAKEVVGRITLSGTIGFLFFTGLVGGAAFGALYLVVRRLLPTGRLGGVVYGLGLLAVFGVLLDPLRRGNPDFDLVGPGWLAVFVFTALAGAYGLAAAGVAAWTSSWLPLPSTRPAILVRYVPPAVVAVVAFPLTIVLAVAGAVVVIASRWRPVVAFVRSTTYVERGRVLAGVAALAGIPFLVVNAVDIVAR